MGLNDIKFQKDGAIYDTFKETMTTLRLMLSDRILSRNVNNTYCILYFIDIINIPTNPYYNLYIEMVNVLPANIFDSYEIKF